MSSAFLMLPSIQLKELSLLEGGLTAILRDYIRIIELRNKKLGLI
jgi:hypothetical protein